MQKALTLLVLAGAAASASAAISIVNNVPGAWIDISGTGTALSLSDDSSAQIGNTVSNALVPANAFVHSNGTIGLTSATDFSNDPIPSTLHGGQFAAPMWDDFNPGAGGTIHWQEIAGVLVVQWTNVPYFGSTDNATFQIQVFGSGNYAQYLYQNVSSTRDAGDSATIGAQVSAAEFATWSLNSASISSDTVLTVTPAPGAAALLGLGGLLIGRRRR